MDGNIHEIYYYYYSIIGNVGISVPTGQIREFSTFIVSSSQRYSPSVRRAIAANGMCRVLDI
jgi:hypothetical protein